MQDYGGLTVGQNRMQVEDICSYDVQNRNKSIFENEDCPGILKDDIKSIINREGFVKYDVKINKISMNGSNYIAQLYDVNIVGTTLLKGEKEINLFIKQMFQSESKLFDISNLFRSEQFFYKEISQVYNELQEEAKIVLDERLNLVKSYDSNPGSIIMDNLCKKGYKVYPRLDVVTLEFANLAVKNLAKFHALSFVAEDRRPEFFDKKIKTLKCPLNFGDEWHKFKESMSSMVIDYLEESVQDRVKDTILKKLNKYPQYFEKADVMCLYHGDYRVMNIMIKEDNEKITDMIPLDYQGINYGTPMMDLIYFIFTATDKKFRKSHMENLKNLYFETLKSFLKYFDIEVEDVFPRKTFERMYEEAMDYGLIVIVLLAPIILADENDAPDLEKQALETARFKVDDVYKDRLRDVCEDFIEWGYL